MTEFIFDRKELATFLQHDVVPGRLQNLWNSLVVNHQISSPFLWPWHSIQRTEFMNRLIQQGAEEKIYHGRKANLMPNDLEENKSYINVITGYSFEPSGHLEIGVNRAGRIGVPEAIGVIPPGPYFPVRQGCKNIEALNVYFNYTSRDTLPIRFHFAPLGVSRPENREQAVSALRVIGDAIGKIKEGKPVDFGALRQDLLDKAGLSVTGAMDEMLGNVPQPAAAAPQPAAPAPGPRL